MGDFERDTRVNGSAGKYRATLSPDWEIWGPNGGYVAAIALRAAGAEAKIPRPASFSAHFLSVARFASVDLEVTPLRLGRRSESFRVSMRQEGRLILEAIVRTAAVGPGLEHDVAKAPEVPGPENLKSTDELRGSEGPTFPFWSNLDARPIHSERFNQEWAARAPVFQEWYRFRPRATFEDPFVDAGRLLLLVDTLSWPAAAQPHPRGSFIAPNMDITTWFHRSALESEWLLADQHSPIAEAGLMGCHGRVWSRQGKLLASGGCQLMCIPAS